MRAVIFGVLVAAFGVMPAVGAEETATHATALRRMTLVVADIDASVKFYAGVLGYSVSSDSMIAAADAGVLLALTPADKARFVVLRGPESEAGASRAAASIGLLAISRKARLPVLRQPVGNRFATGQAMMAMETEDFDGVLARLKAFGAPLLAGPVVGHGGTQIEIVTSDPDGTRIHIVGKR